MTPREAVTAFVLMALWFILRIVYAAYTDYRAQAKPRMPDPIGFKMRTECESANANSNIGR